MFIHLLLEIVVSCSLTLNQPLNVPKGWVLSGADLVGQVKACVLNENVLRCPGQYVEGDSANTSKIWLKKTINDGEMAKLPVGCREVTPAAPSVQDSK
jgi:hypothetical protein